MVSFRTNRHLLLYSLLVSSIIPVRAPANVLTTALAVQPAFYTSSASTMSSPASPEWLQERLTTLLNSPYIHFRNPGPLGLRMGPGPIDLFSTRFNNMFTHDATGVLAGNQVDRQGLKEGILALQKRWYPDTATFTAQDAAEPQHAATRFAWVQKNSESPTEFTASASVHEEGGTPRISSLKLDGDEALFTN